MPKYFQSIAVLTVLMFANVARAGLYFEPYLGYDIGKFGDKSEQSQPAVITTSTDNNYSGWGLGAKLGASVTPVFSVGGDLMLSRAKIGTSDATVTEFGPYVSCNINNSVKLSATYYLQSNIAYTNSTAKGTGYKLGIGIPFGGMYAFNVDFINTNYKTIDLPSGIQNTSYTASRTTTMLGFSLLL